MAISGDSPFCHAEFQKARRFPFPLLSDVHRTAIAASGVLDQERNVAFRSTFVVDGHGEMVRDGAEIVRVLDLIASLRKKA